jgi:hypothetical protein
VGRGGGGGRRSVGGKRRDPETSRSIRIAPGRGLDGSLASGLREIHPGAATVGPRKARKAHPSEKARANERRRCRSRRRSKCARPPSGKERGSRCEEGRTIREPTFVGSPRASDVAGRAVHSSTRSSSRLGETKSRAAGHRPAHASHARTHARTHERRPVISSSSSTRRTCDLIQTRRAPLRRRAAGRRP